MFYYRFPLDRRPMPATSLRHSVGRTVALALLQRCTCYLTSCGKARFGHGDVAAVALCLFRLAYSGALGTQNIEQVCACREQQYPVTFGPIVDVACLVHNRVADRCASAWLKVKVAASGHSHYHGSGAVVPSTVP
eukprot:413199-Alexandrium_andersonii.AAC.1